MYQTSSAAPASTVDKLVTKRVANYDTFFSDVKTHPNTELVRCAHSPLPHRAPSLAQRRARWIWGGVRGRVAAWEACSGCRGERAARVVRPVNGVDRSLTRVPCPCAPSGSRP